jgi:16S rRNA (cytidine1402-2'-O)-methyltransferase
VGRLQVVATPIGNLGDLSPRAADALVAADLVCAEDTRRTGRLLAEVGSDAPQWSLHDHNERTQVPAVLARLADHDVVVLVSDAGTPAVSDPGHRLVAAAVAAGHVVEAIPGPSAVLTALVASGLASDRFTFEGFLPRKGRSRADRLAELATEPRTMVLFVAPHRAAVDLADLATACGADRPAVLGRELTKLHEEYLRGTLGELAAAVSQLRGELTLVVAGAPEVVEPASIPDLVARVRALQAEGLAPRAAVKQVAATADVSTRELYDAVHGGGASG